MGRLPARRQDHPKDSHEFWVVGAGRAGGGTSSGGHCPRARRSPPGQSQANRPAKPPTPRARGASRPPTDTRTDCNSRAAADQPNPRRTRIPDTPTEPAGQRTRRAKPPANPHSRHARRSPLSLAGEPASRAPAGRMDLPASAAAHASTMCRAIETPPGRPNPSTSSPARTRTHLCPADPPRLGDLAVGQDQRGRPVGHRREADHQRPRERPRLVAQVPHVPHRQRRPPRRSPAPHSPPATRRPRRTRPAPSTGRRGHVGCLASNTCEPFSPSLVVHQADHRRVGTRVLLAAAPVQMRRPAAAHDLEPAHRTSRRTRRLGTSSAPPAPS